LSVRASPDEAERTTITYDSAAETLTVDGSRSSLDADVDHPTVYARLSPDQDGAVRFHVFLDRSVLEVFVADLVCITQRLYPKREDSLGLSFTIKKGSAIVRHLSVWRLASIWPDKAVKGG
jgi:sucrose-6-phosphate hydrolase SacC (GH32 family)